MTDQEWENWGYPSDKPCFFCNKESKDNKLEPRFFYTVCREHAHMSPVKKERNAMRKPTYLSPSAISLYESDPEHYYLKYISDLDLPRDPQTQPMSIGSAFDAYVKAYLHERLFGKDHDPKFELDTLLEAQVDKQHLDWARIHGKYVFEQYKQSGALSDLMLELKTASSDPRFEFEIRGAVHGFREGKSEQIGEVVLLGKPDVDFVTKNGVHCILDFKVNGYCSKYAKSPSPYYLRLRAAGGTNYGMHNKCRPFFHHELEVNRGAYLEDVDVGWARQLAIYGWLCGEPVGSPFVTIIHQLCCSPSDLGLPSIRVAEHVNLIGPPFQQKVFDKAVTLWEIVQSDHFFRDLTLEQSQSRCAMLEKVYRRQMEEALYWAS